MRHILGLLLLALLHPLHATAAGEQVGEVVFVIGSALHADGSKITKGAPVYVGQTMETGANGHIHLRMVDQAFVSLRPDSRLRIDAYRYDPTTPANNRVKIFLERGVSRNVTGEAGAAAKENYRLNTPLAAIGIHGTDYVVQALPEAVRVSVSSGAIAMSPLGENCGAESYGPCDTAATRRLTGAMQNAYLELRARGVAPVLVPAVNGGNAPNQATPPHHEEPRATPGDARAASGETVTERVASVLTATAPASPRSIWWGRWSAFVDPASPGKSLVAQLAPGREAVVSNQVFGLVRTTGQLDLPASGAVSFRLAESEAYLREGQNLSPAAITDPRLSIDFGARRFATSLTFTHPTQQLVMSAQGTVNFQGYLYGDAANSDMQVLGAVTGQGKDAGYLFERDLGSSISAVGATRWVQ